MTRRLWAPAVVAILVAMLAAPAMAQTIPQEPTRPLTEARDRVYTYPHQQTTALVCDGEVASAGPLVITEESAGTINPLFVTSQRWEIDYAAEYIEGPGRISPSEHANTKLFVLSEGFFDNQGRFRGTLEWDGEVRHWNNPARVGNGFFEAFQFNQYRMLERPGLWALVSINEGIESGVITSTVCMIDARIPDSAMQAAAKGDPFVPLSVWLGA